MTKSTISVSIPITDQDRKYVAMSNFKPEGTLATDKDIQMFIYWLFMDSMTKWRNLEEEGQFNDCDACDLDNPSCNNCLGA